jgi:4-hydroxybenzoate polyprenyltransferase
LVIARISLNKTASEPAGGGPAPLRPLIRALCASARPAQLVKSGIAVCWGIYCANGNHLVFHRASVLALVGTIILGAGLYGLNDLTDLAFDKTTVHKQFRPLPAARIHSDQLLVASSIEITCALSLLTIVGVSALSLGAVLLLNQLAYSFEPFRCKRRLGLDILSAAVLSHGARFALGFGGGTLGPTACLACAALVFWKIAGYLLYRLEDVPPCGVPKTDTAQALGLRKATVLSTVALACSYGCFAVYAIRSLVPALGFVLFSLLYVTAVAVYVRFWERGATPATLNLFVFSATAQER